MDNRLSISILKMRKNIYEWYQQNNRRADWLFKGLAALLLFLSVNSLYGSTGGVMTVIAAVMAVLCAVLPMKLIYPAVILLTALHMWQISWDMALIYLAVVILSYLLVCRYQPDTAIILAFTPLFFTLRLAFLLPLLVGIFSSFFGMAAMVFGVVFYFMGLHSQNVVALLSSVNGSDSVLPCLDLLKSMAADHNMLLLIGAFLVAAVVAYVLYHQSFEYAWYIGITAGGLAGLVVYLIGDIVFDIEGTSMIHVFMIPVAILIAAAVQFIRCIIDYSGVEYAEFEDDEYYYYVKAVPKVKEIVEDFTALDFLKKQKKTEQEENTPEPDEFDFQ